MSTCESSVQPSPIQGGSHLGKHRHTFKAYLAIIGIKYSSPTQSQRSNAAQACQKLTSTGRTLRAHLVLFDVLSYSNQAQHKIRAAQSS